MTSTWINRTISDFKEYTIDNNIVYEIYSVNGKILSTDDIEIGKWYVSVNTNNDSEDYDDATIVNIFIGQNMLDDNDDDDEW